MAENMKLMVPQKEQEGMRSVLELLDAMSEEQKQDMLMFLRGVEAGLAMAEKRAV